MAISEKQQTNGILSLVGAGTTIEGKVKTDGSMRIDGKVVGDVTAKANITIGGTGAVEGTVTAANISLAGRVQGTMVASRETGPGKQVDHARRHPGCETGRGRRGGL